MKNNNLQHLRTQVQILFKKYLNGGYTPKQLAEWLRTLESVERKGRAKDEGLWFRIDGSGCITIGDIEKDLTYPTLPNYEYMVRKLRDGSEPLSEIEIYFS